MARLLIETRDRAEPHCGRGDVIDVFPDDWRPSRSEAERIRNGDWTVLDVPGVARERLIDLRAGMDETDENGEPVGLKAKRASRCDVAALGEIARSRDVTETDVRARAWRKTL